MWALFIFQTLFTPLSKKLLKWGELENSYLYCGAGAEVNMEHFITLIQNVYNSLEAYPHYSRWHWKYYGWWQIIIIITLCMSLSIIKVNTCYFVTLHISESAIVVAAVISDYIKTLHLILISYIILDAS